MDNGPRPLDKNNSLGSGLSRAPVLPETSRTADPPLSSLPASVLATSKWGRPSEQM